MMTPSKTTTAAALALMAHGINAIGPYANSETTVTVEPYVVGSATSSGVVVYSMNYCTIVQNTACQVTLSTGGQAPPEYSTVSTVVGESTGVVTVPVSTTVGGETAITAISGTDVSISQFTPEVTQSGEAGVPVTDGQPSTTVISTTDRVGSPTLLTTSLVAATDSVIISTETAGETASSASTTGRESNSTVAVTHQPPGTTASTTTGADSAPSHTGAGADLQVIPAAALGAAIMAMVCLI
ncbi:hypothetical protein PT974_03982 [Cladobotryum mycophilum]|uniref:Uncharacterized protein n=1 Tax=Cladobotryum mycophilum TaxID=491253 RepID=A0ABR0SU64_9HYPO